MNTAMESGKSVHMLGKTIHSLLGWKSRLTTNWVESVCDIMKIAPSEKDDGMCIVISKIEDELSVLTDYINHLNTQRRHILNEFLDLRGNIRVFCRIRPISVEEKFSHLSHVTAMDTNNVILKLADNKTKTYSFDKVFHPDSTQDEVFGEVEPVIKSALDGYNTCIFAYGQTGTGKSYTMEGTPNTPGVVSRAMEAIFKQAEDSNRVFVFSFSMLEIYLGNLKDLLVPQATRPMDPMPPCLLIQTNPKGGIEIDNLVAIRVTDFNQALRLYRLGCRFRSTASTNSNSASSRSHCLIRLSITCFNAPERRRETNKIWFIDLGGSERVLKTKASGRRLDEGKAINLSLSALGDVIHALHKKNCHVPYRNSKLTQVLKDSLGEDSKTLMLVHVSPKEEDICETVCSLSFATRVRSIHVGNAESTEEKEQRESAIANLQQKMKMIEGERKDVRRNINNLNEELERLTGKPLSSMEELDTSHLLKQKTKTSKTPESNKEASSTDIPRFMKATVCSIRRKTAVDLQTFEERRKFPARRRRAESVSFPVKRRSEYNSECSISRNSCLVDLNVKSNVDNETEYSHYAAECDIIKNVIFTEQETSSKNSDNYGKGKKNSFKSANILKVDNWLRLHKNEPTIRTISHKNKRILAISVREKKQTRNGEKQDKNKMLKKSAQFKQEVEIQKPGINLDRDTKCDGTRPVDDNEVFIESVPPIMCCDGSFCSNQDNEYENDGDSTSADDSDRCLFSCSEGFSLDNDVRLEMEDSDSSMSMSEQELLGNVITVNKGIDAVHCSSEIGTKLGICNKRTQRALSMLDEHHDAITQQLKSLEVPGLYSLLLGKIQIVCVGALLALGFHNLGLEHDFFHGLTI